MYLLSAFITTSKSRTRVHTQIIGQPSFVMHISYQKQIVRSIKIILWISDHGNVSYSTTSCSKMQTRACNFLISFQCHYSYKKMVSPGRIVINTSETKSSVSFGS